jgi:hypothetical protein
MRQGGKRITGRVKMKIKSSDPIPTALAEIASLLRQEAYETQAAHIESLRKAAMSSDSDRQEHFRLQITQNKVYWLGMGTIADISFHDRDLNRRFCRAYVDLADACEQAGLSSIYSRKVADIFGEWIRKGAV